MLHKIKRYVRRNNGIKGAVSMLWKKARIFGPVQLIKRMSGRMGEIEADYTYWITNCETKYAKDVVNEEIQSFSKKPLISVLLPVYNVEEEYLHACIQSIQNQFYGNWELCIADDASTKEHVREILQAYEQTDERIRVVYRKKNGHISRATNSALRIATGEFIALIDNDDMLKPEALFEMVKEINKHVHCDMLYSDEDKVSADGATRIWPAFKPDWSRDNFLCQMYIGHLGVYRRSLAEKIGGFRSDFVGSQDYDFALRISECTRNIYHVPKVLYHWRMIPTSTASGTDVKNYAFDASYRAKQEWLSRQKVCAKQHAFIPQHSTTFDYCVSGDELVTIILMPDEAQLRHISKYIEAIERTISGIKIEFVVGSELFQEHPEWMLQSSNIHCINTGEGLYCKAKQLVESARGSFILFLGADATFTSKHALIKMVGHAKQPHTGAVSGAILSHKRYILSAGELILFETNAIAHSYYGYFEEDIQNVDRLLLQTNYLAFTEDMLLIQKNKISAYFDEGRLLQTEACFYDLCLSLYNDGLFNVYRGDAQINLSKIRRRYRSSIFQAETVPFKELFSKWKPVFGHDPFYNKNFSQKTGDYTIDLKSDIHQ